MNKVQIRSSNGSCCEVNTVRQAVDLKDEEIIKISFSFGSERIILDKTLNGDFILRTDPAFLFVPEKG